MPTPMMLPTMSAVAVVSPNPALERPADSTAGAAGAGISLPGSTVLTVVLRTSMAGPHDVPGRHIYLPEHLAERAHEGHRCIRLRRSCTWTDHAWHSIAHSRCAVW